MASVKPARSAVYRALQFFAALKAGLPGWAGGGLTPVDTALVAAILTTPSQRQLFDRMPPNDRRHAAAVARTLQVANHYQSALLQAALLHDIAKSIGQPILYRVLIVLLKAFWPALLVRVSKSAKRRIMNDEQANNSAYSSIPQWRRPFVIHADHPAIGAAWAAEAGCDPLAVRLIARHQDSLTCQTPAGEDQLLAALQWADDLN
jgi:hypothetical protein